jgi:hypothetical protein
MPAIIAPEAWPAWLGEEPADEVQLRALLAPYPSVQALYARWHCNRCRRQRIGVSFAVRALYEATYFVGLRKAGMPEQ